MWRALTGAKAPLRRKEGDSLTCLWFLSVRRSGSVLRLCLRVLLQLRLIVEMAERELSAYAFGFALTPRQDEVRRRDWLDADSKSRPAKQRDEGRDTYPRREKGMGLLHYARLVLHPPVSSSPSCSCTPICLPTISALRLLSFSVLSYVLSSRTRHAAFFWISSPLSIYVYLCV